MRVYEHYAKITVGKTTLPIPNYRVYVKLSSVYKFDWEKEKNYLIDNNSDPYYSLHLWKDVRNI